MEAREVPLRLIGPLTRSCPEATFQSVEVEPFEDMQIHLCEDTAHIAETLSIYWILFGIVQVLKCLSFQVPQQQTRSSLVLQDTLSVPLFRSDSAR